MGLLDNPQDAAMMQLGFGLLSAGGPSRMPVSFGQALGSAGNQAMDAYRQAKQLQDMEEMKKLQIEQLRGALEQQKMQLKVPGMIQEALSGISQAPKPQVYQDQLPNNADVGGDLAPQKYFELASKIPDKNERLAAIEAGFRKWPDMRPVMNRDEQAAFSRDAATRLANVGMSIGAAGLKGSDAILKAAEFYKPQELKEGSTYRNPLTGETQYMPKMDVGMRPGANGSIEAVPGVMDFLRQKTTAMVSPVDRTKTMWETGIDPLGNGNSTGSGGGSNGLTPKGAAAVKEGAFTGGNDDWIKNSYRPTLDAAKSADNMLTNVQSLRNIDINTGWGTEAKAAAANALSGLGIAPKNAEMFAANAQKFQSQAMTRLWEVLNTAKGPQTEGDADRAKATFAALKNTNEANQFILDLAEANARRDKLKAQFYGEAMPVARDSGDMTAVDRKWQQIQRSVWDDPIMAKWRK